MVFQRTDFSYGEPVDAKTYAQAGDFLDRLLRVLHPVMPFITEELWQHLADRTEGESIMYAPMPAVGEVDEKVLADVTNALEIVNGIRGVRARKNIPQRENVTFNVVGASLSPEVLPLLIKLGGLDKVVENAEKDPVATSFMVGTVEFNVPMAQSADKDAEIARINKELEYLQGFLRSVEKKLGNERFVANAPAAVVEAERRKQADATAKIATLTANLEALK